MENSDSLLKGDLLGTICSVVEIYTKILKSKNSETSTIDKSVGPA